MLHPHNYVFILFPVMFGKSGIRLSTIMFSLGFGLKGGGGAGRHNVL